jgi:hypothetical protein
VDCDALLIDHLTCVDSRPIQDFACDDVDGLTFQEAAEACATPWNAFADVCDVLPED